MFVIEIQDLQGDSDDRLTIAMGKMTGEGDDDSDWERPARDSSTARQKGNESSPVMDWRGIGDNNDTARARCVRHRSDWGPAGIFKTIFRTSCFAVTGFFDNEDA
jgi:hypothetical protein